MKTIIISIISIFFAAQAASAQVGIGTMNPSSNSVLDLTSPNKGLMLPRVASTSAVSSPTAGLMIYNMSTQSPAFYNGTVWNSLASALSGTTGDSITYSIYGPGNPLFVAGNYKVTAISFGGSNPGTTVNSTYIMDVNFTKNKDINSIGFINSMIQGLLHGAIEFKIYVPGQATPYYSIKLTNWRVSNAQQGTGYGGVFTENISATPGIIGYKDWTNNISFSFNLTTQVIGTY
jgi:type VI protein secretion system component Hcp